VGSFGERLRQQREMRGISLDEIVATTKIGRRLLLALEDEQFDLLPGGIFNKAYVRAYAKCVGIDEDEAVAGYLEAAHETPPDTKVIAHQHAFHSEYRPERASFPVVPVLILLVVAAGAVGGWMAYQDHRRERQLQIATTKATEQETTTPALPTNKTEPPATNSVPPPIATQSPTQQAATPDKPPAKSSAAATKPEQTSLSSETAAPAGAQFEVTIRPKGPAWVSVKADGKYVVRGIIKPPDVKTIQAANQVVFYTGNAGSVDVAFNGKYVQMNEGINQEQTLVFDARGLLQQPATQ
jgi:cytoskeleton protein RodZ